MKMQTGFLVFVLLVIAPCLALGGGIPNGGSVTGTIAVDGETDTLVFSGSAGQQGVISVSGDVIGGELIRVLNPDDSELAATGAKASLTLPQTGTYTVVVSSFQAAGTGSYEVHLALAPGADEHGAIPNGGSTNQSIDADGEIDSFTFTGSAGQEGFISVSGDVVTGEQYRVFDPSGALLTIGGAQEFLSLPQSGTYTVIVSSLQAAGTGGYAMHLALAPGANEHGPIPDGGSVSEAIDADGEIDSFTFEGLNGQPGTISIIGNVVGGQRLTVFGPDGIAIDATNNDLNLQLTQTGTYTVVVRSFQASGTGSYTINLALEDPVLPGVLLAPDPLEFGDLALSASTTRILGVQNSGNAPLGISAIALTGRDSADFGIAAQNCVGAVLAVDASCGIEISFSPSAPGLRRAGLQVFSNAPSSPDRARLTGSNDVLFSDGFE